jgi:site-specific recombinase XerD
VFDVTNIRYLAEQAIEDAKLNEGVPDNQHFTIYGLKHCYASHLIMNGASLHEVGELLGHTDDKMVRKHYAHLTQDYLRKVQAKVNLTPELKPQLEVIG